MVFQYFVIEDDPESNTMKAPIVPLLQKLIPSSAIPAEPAMVMRR